MVWSGPSPFGAQGVLKKARRAGTCTKKLTLLLVCPDAVTVIAWLPPGAELETAKLAWIWVLELDVIVAVMLEPALIEGLVPKPFPLSVTLVVALTGPWAGEILDI
jgi:hypothetical protein